MGRSGVEGGRAARRRAEREERKRGGTRPTPEGPPRAKRIPHGLLAVLGGVLVVGLAVWLARPEVVPVDGYRVVARHPHDRDAYCQGLLLHDGRLFESTGRYEKSELREVELATGKVLRRRALSAKEFGEGLALVGDELFQLTWRAGKAHIIGRDDFRPRRQVEYEGQGWGLAYDGESLIMSDGSDVLSFRDPETFAVRRTVSVTAAGDPVRQLNELEWIEGEIFANVYQDDRIARIDPETGEVTRWLDLSGLLGRDERKGGENVLNGIAWDEKARRLYVTGKLWPLLFEIEIVPEGD